jgi:benzoate/toluate 1,2-dioxygenase alpha subunit
MKHIFESNWVYLAHESQIPDNNDYYTTWIGRQPVVITRDKTGELNAVLNACAHKGAMLCRRKQQQGQLHVPVPRLDLLEHRQAVEGEGRKTTEYPVQFNTNGSHDLKKIARFQSYRGFLFGSLSDDVLPLEDYRRRARDHRPDRRPGANGLEVLRGNSSYIYEGNWKMQMENGCDGYHVSTVHWNYAADGPPQGRRHQGRRCERLEQVGRGVYGFDHGHILLWTKTMNPEVRPVYRHRDEIAARVGRYRPTSS